MIDNLTGANFPITYQIEEYKMLPVIPLKMKWMVDKWLPLMNWKR